MTIIIHRTFKCRSLNNYCIHSLYACSSTYVTWLLSASIDPIFLSVHINWSMHDSFFDHDLCHDLISMAWFVVCHDLWHDLIPYDLLFAVICGMIQIIQFLMICCSLTNNSTCFQNNKVSIFCSRRVSDEGGKLKQTEVKKGAVKINDFDSKVILSADEFVVISLTFYKFRLPGNPLS